MEAPILSPVYEPGPDVYKRQQHRSELIAENDEIEKQNRAIFWENWNNRAKGLPCLLYTSYRLHYRLWDHMRRWPA